MRTTPSLGVAPVRTAKAATRREGRERDGADPLPSRRMSFAKLALACGLAAIALSACGSSTKPVPGSSTGTAATSAGRGVVDDPRARHLTCMQQHHLPVVKVGDTNLQVGAPGSGPTINFQPTPGSAQERQIEAQAQNAEVIGSALLYPNQAPDDELQVIESCLALGVKG